MPTTVTMTGPGSAVVTDDAAAAITLQTTALTGAISGIATVQIGTIATPGSLLFLLSQINTTLAKINDNDQTISKAVGDLNSAIGSLASAQSKSNQIQEMAAANQITTNNFQMQVTKEALKRADLPLPTLPSPKEQLETAVKEGLSLNVVSAASGAVTSMIESTAKGTATWIASTEIYRSAASYVTRAKDSLIAIIPPSLYTTQVAATSAKSPN
jgi:hypothetical protein